MINETLANFFYRKSNFWTISLATLFLELGNLLPPYSICKRRNMTWLKDFIAFNPGMAEPRPGYLLTITGLEHTETDENKFCPNYWQVKFHHNCLQKWEQVLCMKYKLKDAFVSSLTGEGVQNLYGTKLFKQSSSYTTRPHLMCAVKYTTSKLTYTQWCLTGLLLCFLLIQTNF